MSRASRRVLAAKAAPTIKLPPAPRPPMPREWVTLVLLSVVLFLVHTYAARVVGFGDSEALYVCYALHPAPAYLDHPGLVGDVARYLGNGGAPRPETVHVLTSVVGALVPGLFAATARVAGASMRAAAVAGLVALASPMMAIGLFALTPDLLLAPLWLLALALGAFATREAKSGAGKIAWLFYGVVAGLATWAKLSGALLFLVPAALFVKSGPHRKHAFAGIGLGLLVTAPLVRFEVQAGFPMLRHRLIETQQTGLPWLVKGLGSLTIGQVLYVSPVLAWLVVVGVRAALRHRRDEDATARFLSLAVLVPGVVLACVTLASRQAEPHWMAPAWLALPILFAYLASQGRPSPTVPSPSPRLVSSGIAVALLFTVAVHAWILSPRALALAPKSYDPKVDIANELYGWPRAIEAVNEAASPGDVVVGPHWVVCAQLHAALPGIRVGCNTPIRDDFDGWLPRETWKTAERVLYVTDARFPATPESVLPGYTHSQDRRVVVYRGGRPVRTFSIATMDRVARQKPAP